MVLNHHSVPRTMQATNGLTQGLAGRQEVIQARKHFTVCVGAKAEYQADYTGKVWKHD